RRFPARPSVSDVVAPPAPALATLWAGFAVPRREGNGPILAALVGETGTIELRAKKAGLVRLVFDAALESGNGSLHVGDGSRDVAVPLAGATTPVSVIVQVPSGQWQVLVKTDGDSIVDLSQPRTEEASGAAALVAQSPSPDPG